MLRKRAYDRLHATDGYLVETSNLHRVLSETMTGLPHEDDSVFLSLTVKARSRRLCHVQAGIKLHDLYCELEATTGGRNMGTDPEGIVFDDGPPGVLVQHGYALPTMGGSAGQSLAGAISTSTHGGDTNLSMVDMVQAIHLVGAGGVEFFIQRGVPNAIVDPDLLASKNPCIGRCQIISDDETFYAAVVSMGRMGIIVSMVIEVVPQFFLAETNVQTTWETLRGSPDGVGGYPKQILDGLLQWSQGGKYLQVFVLPYATANGAHPTIVTTRTHAPFSSGSLARNQVNRCMDGSGQSYSLWGMYYPPPTSGGPLPYLCEESPLDLKGTIVNFINLLSIATGAAVPVAGGIVGLAVSVGVTLEPVEEAVLGPFAPVFDVLASIFGGYQATRAAAEVATAATELIVNLTELLADPQSNLGDYLKVIIGIVAQNGQIGWAEQLLNDVLSSAFTLSKPPATIETANGVRINGTPSKVDISYQVMDTFDYRANCENKVLSLEAAFNADEGGYIQYVDRVLEIINNTANNDSYIYTGYVSLRYCGRSHALMAIEQWENTVCIETTVIYGSADDLPVLEEFEGNASAFGALIHWGQQNTRSRAEIEIAFPPGNVEAWRSALARLTLGQSQLTFDNDFCADHGLETYGAEAPFGECALGPAYQAPPLALPEATVGPTMLPKLPPLPTIVTPGAVHVPLPPQPERPIVVGPGLQSLAITKFGPLHRDSCCACCEGPEGPMTALSSAYVTSPRATRLASGQ